MDGPVFTLLAWSRALCSALMAGTYLAFSGFIMRALASLGTARAIATMDAINVTILKSAFMPLFFGSTIIGLLMVLAGLWQWGEPGAGRVLTGGVTYVVGMFIVTAGANVPLNNALAKLSGEGQDAGRSWARYLEHWTRWNTVRACASLVTLIVSIELLGR